MEQTVDKLPIDHLAELDADQTIFYVSVVPLFFLVALTIAWFVLYVIKRAKNWNEIGEAMRIDEEEPTHSNESFPPQLAQDAKKARTGLEQPRTPHDKAS